MKNTTNSTDIYKKVKTFYHFQTIVSIAALVAVAVAAPAGPPAYGPAPVYPDVAPAYTYAYAAADDYSGVNFGATETRDGYATSGSYNVALPDGRIQTVTYRVDDAYGGYVADVTYSGEAVYAPAPAHPVVHAAPVHAAPVHHAPIHHAPIHHAPAFHHAPVHHPLHAIPFHG